MDYKTINTTDKMNKSIKEMLRMKGDNISLYALKRIEELENLTHKPQIK